MRKKAKEPRRGRQAITIRLGKPAIRQLDKVAYSLGYVDRSQFLREFVEAVIAGDLTTMNAFLAKAQKHAIEQMQAQLPGLMEAPIGAKGRRAQGGSSNAR
jgi:hypothetical protein